MVGHYTTTTVSRATLRLVFSTCCPSPGTCTDDLCLVVQSQKTTYPSCPPTLKAKKRKSETLSPELYVDHINRKRNASIPSKAGHAARHTPFFLTRHAFIQRLKASHLLKHLLLSGMGYTCWSECMGRLNSRRRRTRKAHSTTGTASDERSQSTNHVPQNQQQKREARAAVEGNQQQLSSQGPTL